MSHRDPEIPLLSEEISPKEPRSTFTKPETLLTVPNILIAIAVFYFFFGGYPSKGSEKANTQEIVKALKSLTKELKEVREAIEDMVKSRQ